MKKITSLFTAAIIAASFSVSAQNYDVGVKRILSPANGATITAGVYTVGLTLQNYGDSLMINDSIKLALSIDGATVLPRIGTPARAYSTGDTVNLSLTLNLGSLTAGSHSLCFRTTEIFGKTDSDTTNNESCSNFTIVLPDLGVDSVAVSSPATKDGDTLRTGTSITQVFVRVRNFGTQPYSAAGVAIALNINGSNQALNLPLNQAIPAGGSVGGNVPANLIPAQPNTRGTYDVCANTTLTDADANNNQSCVNMKVHDEVTIASISPGKGKVGSDVTVTGKGYSVVATENKVELNGLAATVKSSTETTITFTVPTGATTGKVKVMAYNQEATSTVDFMVEDESGNVVYPASIDEVSSMSKFLGYYNNTIEVKASNINGDLIVHDITGKEVASFEVSASNTKTLFEVNFLNEGIYLVTLGSEYMKFSK